MAYKKYEPLEYSDEDAENNFDYDFPEVSENFIETLEERNKKDVKFKYSIMNSRLKHNLLVWLCYSVACYIILLPLELLKVGISISIIIGFLFGTLNSIVQELRKLNKK